MAGTLYIVATPIGNLGDISTRAVEVLRTVDLVACEDTRHTRKLLNHLGISTKTISYHQHNERDRTRQLVDRLLQGTSVAVVSDAGTPGISDPGFAIVNEAASAGIRVESIPGAVAFVNGAVLSGLLLESIFFGGFLPAKAGERRKRLEEVRNIPATLVFYEAPHRITRSIADCLLMLGDRPAAIARELTKLHEQVIRGPLSELIRLISNEPVRGEIVVVIAPPPAEVISTTATPLILANRVAELQAEGADHKAALKTAAKEFGVTRSEAYRMMLQNN